MEGPEFTDAVRGLIRDALNAAARSPDVRDEEPFLVELVALIRAQPDHRQLAVQELCGLLPRLESSHGVIDLLEYCMHTLRPPELVAAVTEHAESARAVLASGATMLPWHTVHLCEGILEAESPTWEAQDMYESLAKP